MTLIPLSQGLFAKVDDSDADWLNQWKWYAHKDRNTFYARRVERLPNGEKRAIRMHAAIAGGSGFDHRDGDGLNNQRSNLRAASGSQNNANQRKRAGCTSHFKGVCWESRRSQWKASIKRRTLGYFRTELEAARAYNTAAIGAFGEFALLNPL